MKIVPDTPTVELNEGEELTSRVCSADGEPSCSYAWHNNSESGPVVEPSDTLSMSSVERYDDGSYHCNASNILDSVHDQFDLIVNCK